MTFGYVSQPGRGANDALLCAVASLLTDAGLRLAGTVQSLAGPQDQGLCDMDIRVLPDGPCFRISQMLGPQSRGCRLDPGGVEQAVVAVTPRLAGADLLIVNKFGKLEAEGRGFCGLIAEAVGQGIPVLVGVNALNLDDFMRFSAGMAVGCGPDPADIATWALAAVADRHQADQARPTGHAQPELAVINGS